MKKTGVKGGPREGINGKIHEILKDNPVVSPPCTYSSLTRRIVANKRIFSPVKGMVVDSDEESSAEETPIENGLPASKIPHRATQDSIPKSEREYLARYRKMFDALDKRIDELKKLWETLIVIKDSKATTESLDRLITVLERLNEKLDK